MKWKDKYGNTLMEKLKTINVDERLYAFCRLRIYSSQLIGAVNQDISVDNSSRMIYNISVKRP